MHGSFCLQHKSRSARSSNCSLASSSLQDGSAAIAGMTSLMASLDVSKRMWIRGLDSPPCSLRKASLQLRYFQFPIGLLPLQDGRTKQKSFQTLATGRIVISFERCNSRRESCSYRARTFMLLSAPGASWSYMRGIASEISCWTLQQCLMERQLCTPTAQCPSLACRWHLGLRRSLFQWSPSGASWILMLALERPLQTGIGCGS
mmetsp:Transcript_2087/g.3906  ORF Transcript_2087/g.3906 Transcript_2087/m.3906 type:complete len:204 (-) Transcript_2087:388-999(-)